MLQDQDPAQLAAIEQAHAATGSVRGKVGISKEPVRNLFTVLATAAKETADSWEQKGGARKALSFIPRGAGYGFTGLRKGWDEGFNIIFSPNAIMLWNLINGAMLLRPELAIASTMTPLGISWGTICFIGVVTAVALNFGLKAYRIYQTETLRREQRLLVELTDLEHNINLRLEHLKAAGVSTPELDSIRLELKQIKGAPLTAEHKQHRAAKAITRGAFYAVPDTIVSVAATILTGNIVGYVVTGIALSRSVGVEVNNANTLNQKKVDLQNDIEDRKAALGLDYKGHNAEMMTKMRDRYNNYQEVLTALEQEESKINAKRKTYIIHEKALDIIGIHAAHRNPRSHEPTAQRQNYEQQAQTTLGIIYEIRGQLATDKPRTKKLLAALVATETARQNMLSESDPAIEGPDGAGLQMDLVRQELGRAIPPDLTPQLKKLIKTPKTQRMELNKLLSTLEHDIEADAKTLKKFDHLAHDAQTVFEIEKKLTSKPEPEPNNEKKKKAPPPTLEQKYHKLSVIDKIGAFVQSMIEMFAAGLSIRASERLVDPLTHYYGGREGDYKTTPDDRAVRILGNDQAQQKTELGAIKSMNQEPAREHKHGTQLQKLESAQGRGDGRSLP